MKCTTQVRVAQACRQVLFIWAATALLGPLLHAQEIRIKVLNGRNGKPITNECLNIWVDPGHRSNLVAPTNQEGIVVLDIRDNVVTAEAVSLGACRGGTFLGPETAPKAPTAIGVSGGDYVVCQEYGKIIPGEPIVNPVKELMPSYPVKRVLKSGLTAANTCGKIKAEAKPGELVIFVRPPSLLEKLRR